MSFTDKLYNQYYNSAHIADMGGYGLSGGSHNGKGLSGGDAKLLDYKNQLMNAVMQTGGKLTALLDKAYGDGLSGGKMSGGNRFNYNVGRKDYPHSFPMPGYYLGESQDAQWGDGLSGSTKKRKSKSSAGRMSASQNPWIKKLKEYQKKHGVSYKEAMIACKK